MKKSDDMKDIKDSLHTIKGKLEDLHIVSVKQQVILDEHVKRSTMLEEKMVPIEKHVAMVNGAVKFIGLLGVLAAISEAIILAFRGK